MTNEQETSILLARLDERYKALDEKLDSILEQCLKTNGRVTKAEDDIHILYNWKSEVKGNWRAATAIGATVGALVSFIFSFWRNGNQ